MSEERAEREAPVVLEEPPRRQLCVACGYHDGYHHEDCDLAAWTEAEKRAAAGDA